MRIYGTHWCAIHYVYPMKLRMTLVAVSNHGIVIFAHTLTITFYVQSLIKRLRTHCPNHIAVSSLSIPTRMKGCVVYTISKVINIHILDIKNADVLYAFYYTVKSDIILEHAGVV